MGKTSYQNIKELIAELRSQMEALDSGTLELEELEAVVSNSKDLYERLVVIRHKAYEQMATEGAHAQEEVVVVEEETVEEETEVMVEEPEIEEAVEEETAFDFSVDMESVEAVDEEEKEEVQEEEEEEEIEEEVEDEIEEEVEAENEVEDETQEKVEPLNLDVTLNDKLGDGEQSLRKKLQNAPVEDIESEITIARKFEYINSMFGGDKEEYESAIKTLNNCSGAEEARTKLGEYSSNFKWDLEDKAIIKFVELVERRYL